MTTAMERVTSPVDGLSFSRLVLGAMRLPDPGQAGALRIADIVDHAMSLGITTFDHADIYGDYAVEEAFGAGLADWGGDRGGIELITKCDIMLPVPARPVNVIKHYDTSARHIVASVERSLSNLGTDYVDALLLHRPDPLLAVDETAEALTSLVDSGKVRAVGVSNFLPHQLDLLRSRLDLPIVTNQVELSVSSLGALTDGTLDHAQQHGYAPMIWSALGGGEMFTSTQDRPMRIRAVLEQVGGEVGLSAGATALAWVLRHPSSPIPVLGTMNLDRMTDLVTAVGVPLSRQDWFRILQVAQGRDVA